MFMRSHRRREHATETTVRRSSLVYLALPVLCAAATPLGCEPSGDEGDGDGGAGAGSSAGGTSGGGEGGDGSGGTAGSGGGSGTSGSGGSTSAGASSGGSAAGGSSGAAGAGGDDTGGGEGGLGGAGGETDVGEPLVRQVAAGLGFSCALLNSGIVKCWGDDSFGGLGDGQPATGRSPTAVEVRGLGVAKTIRAAGINACAILSDDTVRCWGGNGRLQFVAPGVAAAPGALNGFVAGTASDVALCVDGNGLTSHGCVIGENDAIGCWGSNASFQLGVTTPASSPEVLFVSALEGYRAVVGGYSFTCGLTLGGGVKCWGDNLYGQLGNGMGNGVSMASATPVDVVGLTSGVKQLAASSRTVCALTTAGGVKCWGSPAYGAVGASTNLSQYAGFVPSPLDVLGLTSGVAELAGGNGSFCARIEADGSVKCWGYNQNGELGNQPATITINQFEPVPVDVVGISGTTSIAVGESHTCAAFATGGVKCWGAGTPSGSDLTTNQLVPVFVRGL
jgi:hypothetical protein